MAIAEAALLMSFFSLITPTNWLWVEYAVVFILLLSIAVGWQFLAIHITTSHLQMIITSASFIVLWLGMLAVLGLAVNGLSLGFISGLSSLLVAIIIWWRGITLGQLHLNPRNVRDRIVIAICILSLLSFFNIFTRSPDLWLMTLITFTALVACLPIAHLHSIALSPIGRAIPSTHEYWRWIGPNLLMGATACLLAIFVLNQNLARQIIGLFLTIIFGLFAIVLLPILQPIVEIIIALFQRLRFFDLLSQINITPPQLPAATPNNLTDNTITIPPVITGGITIAILLALGGAVILLTGMARRERESTQRLAEPESVQVDTAQNTTAVDQIKRTLSLRRWLANITVRRLYARMTHEASKRGKRRAKYQTAYDYLPLLDQAFPNCNNDVRILTDAYVAAHYGELPDSPEAIEKLQAAWQRLKRA